MGVFQKTCQHDTNLKISGCFEIINIALVNSRAEVQWHFFVRHFVTAPMMYLLNELNRQIINNKGKRDGCQTANNPKYGKGMFKHFTSDYRWKLKETLWGLAWDGRNLCV